jgi:hypothetical protein
MSRKSFFFIQSHSAFLTDCFFFDGFDITFIFRLSNNPIYEFEYILFVDINLIYKLIYFRLSESDINNVFAELYFILLFSNDKFCISFDKQLSFSIEYNGSPRPIVADRYSCRINDDDDDSFESIFQPSPDR